MIFLYSAGLYVFPLYQFTVCTGCPPCDVRTNVRGVPSEPLTISPDSVLDITGRDGGIS
ncbi:hypothetical protein DPMN_177540 [Dreissena polymorpha]|uniref:Uncharacterized protein n=1 Tax=Dreissena polymorpha TaxID=45954 RepID=A0A9D4ECD2_DREPO|nr:hypothetical protein DPMN_177540 [Dreissena polymorpha]